MFSLALILVIGFVAVVRANNPNKCEVTFFQHGLLTPDQQLTRLSEVYGPFSIGEYSNPGADGYVSNTISAAMFTGDPVCCGLQVYDETDFAGPMDEYLPVIGGASISVTNGVVNNDMLSSFKVIDNCNQCQVTFFQHGLWLTAADQSAHASEVYGPFTPGEYPTPVANNYVDNTISNAVFFGDPRCCSVEIYDEFNFGGVMDEYMAPPPTGTGSIPVTDGLVTNDWLSSFKVVDKCHCDVLEIDYFLQTCSAAFPSVADDTTVCLARVGAAETDIGNIQNDINGPNGINDHLGSIDTTIGNIQGEIGNPGGINDRLDGIDTTNGELRSDVNGNSGQLTTNDGLLSGLRTDVNTNGGRLNGVDGSISTLNSAASDATDRMDYLEQCITDLQSGLQARYNAAAVTDGLEVIPDVGEGEGEDDSWPAEQMLMFGFSIGLNLVCCAAVVYLCFAKAKSNTDKFRDYSNVGSTTA
jgi:hypothetical protein